MSQEVVDPDSIVVPIAPEHWECEECAHMNKLKWKRCGSCGNPKPPSSGGDEPAPVVAVGDVTALAPVATPEKPRDDVQTELDHQQETGYTTTGTQETKIGGDEGEIGYAPDKPEKKCCDPCCFGVCVGCCDSTVRSMTCNSWLNVNGII